MSSLQLKKGDYIKWTILILSLGFAIFVSLLIGPANLFDSANANLNSVVFWDLRLPRTLTAIFVGASLGLGGALLQTLLRNPLAEPYTLGLSGAASFGAVVAIALRLTPFSFFMPLLATIFCLITSVIILIISWNRKMQTSKNLILTGVMMSLFFGSLVVLVMSMLRPGEIQTAMFWMIGQIGTERDQDWFYVAIVFVCVLIWSYVKSRDLDRLLLGEDIANTLGSSVRSLSFQIVLAVSFLIAISVSVSGLIGFVGLLAPHLIKLVFKTHRHLKFLTATVLFAALLLLTSDIFARLIGGDRELPTGGLTALLGAPVLIYLLNKRHSNA